MYVTYLAPKKCSISRDCTTPFKSPVHTELQTSLSTASSLRASLPRPRSVGANPWGWQAPRTGSSSTDPEGLGSNSRGEFQASGLHLREVTSQIEWHRSGTRAAWRKRKGIRRSCCRHRYPRREWRKWRCRRRPRRTRSSLASPAAAPWTWNGAASPIAWFGRPFRCSRESLPASARELGEPGPARRPRAATGQPPAPTRNKPFLPSGRQASPSHCKPATRAVAVSAD